MSSSGKSIAASKCASISISCARMALISEPSRPSSCSLAERSARSLCARIKSMTASACVRSILPFRNARSENSPGRADARPGVETGFENAGRHENSAVAADLDQVFARITGRRAMNREHDLIDQSIALRRSRPAVGCAKEIPMAFLCREKCDRRLRSRLRPRCGSRRWRLRRPAWRSPRWCHAAPRAPRASFTLAGCSKLPATRRCIADFAPSCRPKSESTPADCNLSARAQ